MGWLVCVLASFSSPRPRSWLGFPGNGSLGCTNNNYASREKCRKCGQPKEIAAMPAMSGSSLPTYVHCFARVQGPLGQKMGIRPMGSGGLLEHPLNFWPMGEYDNCGANSASAWQTGFPFVNPISQLPPVPKGWRNGDWICRCGFHNYSSRSQVLLLLKIFSVAASSSCY